jgi:hypothetical protein
MLIRRSWDCGDDSSTTTDAGAVGTPHAMNAALEADTDEDPTTFTDTAEQV